MPVLNEAALITNALRAVTELPNIDEVIVVDGGSSDGTCALVELFPTVQLLRTDRGRASQMNAGAAIATGDVFLFLHADVTLPNVVAFRVHDALVQPDVVAGAFTTTTVADRDARWWLRPLLRLADIRSRYTALPYGDQALFVRAEVFRAVGGFPVQAILEDLELSRRLRSVGAIVTVGPSVRVSGRRFAERPFYFAFLMNLLPLLYQWGVPPERLRDWYGHVR